MKSRPFATAAIGALALTLVACSSTAPSGTVTDGNAASFKLEFQTGLAVDTPILTTLTELTGKFQGANPGVAIDLVPRSNTYEADLKVRLAGRNAPDLWATHGWSLLRYSEFLVPLQNEAWAKNFNPSLDAAMKNKAGEFFAYPVDTDIAGIVYNADALKTAGVDPTKIKSWNDFGQALSALKAAGITPITASGKDNWFAGNLVDWMLSGAYSEAQAKDLANGTFVADGYRLVLDQIAKWRDEGMFNVDYSSATTDDIARALGEAKTGFVFIQNSLTNNALEFNPDAKLGYIPVPSFVGDNYLIGGESQAYGISKASKHIDAAKAYLAFLAQPENTSALAAAAGTIPGLTNAKVEPGHLAASYDAFVAPGNIPLVPYFDRVSLPNGMWNTVVSTADSIITGQADVDAAVGVLKSDFTNLHGQS